MFSLSKPAAWITTVALAFSGLAITSAPAAADAAAGELVVVSVDTADGTAVTTPSLITVNTDGTASTKAPVVLPAAADGDNLPFSLSGSSSAQGYLKRSADGRFLVLTGYAAGPGGYTGDPKDSTATALERVVARVDAEGTIDTTTGLGSAFSVSHSRSATSADGSSFYVTGNGSPGTPTSGVIRFDLGGDNATAISGAWTNTRVVDIADGKLYATSDKTPVKGLGSWSSLPTTSADPTQVALLGGTPTDFALLDVDPAVDGIDTAYVIAEGAAGIAKYTSNGTTWTARGTRAVAVQSITARVVAGKAELFTVQGSAVGNTLVSFTDNAAVQSTGDYSATPTVLATAPGTTSFRGVALAPTDWAPVAPEVPVDPASLPTITFSRAEIAGTVGRTDNPTTTFTVADEETAAGDLDVTVTATSNPAVIDVDDVMITGTGAERTVSVAPQAKGYRAALTFAVTDADDNIGTATLTYSASSKPASDTGFYYYGASDTSTFVEAGDGYILTANDENQTIGLYKQGVTGYPVKEFTFPALAGAETDIEGADRVGDTIYWTGSHGNSRSGGIKLDRRNVFTTTVTGTGASTELTYGSSFTGLWSQLRDWDSSNSHGLGANALGFVAATAEGVLPNPPSGFNVEGFEFAPGSTTTAYFGFRAPSIGADNNALIVPVTNLPALVDGTATQASFGAPILLDLGGRTIRAIAKNAADQYLISAGPGAVEDSWALYTWDGDALTKPVLNRELPDLDATTTGSWESIAPLPASLTAGSSIELIADTGDATLYNGTENKDLNKNIQKSYADTFELAEIAATVIDFSVTVAGRANVGQTLTADVDGLSPSGVSLAYQWLRDGKAIKNATAATYVVTATDLSKKLNVRVTASKDGLTQVVRTTTSTVKVGKPVIAVTGVPTVSGTAQVGAKLVATSVPVTTSPSSKTTRAFQWYANGVAISGAKKSSYTVTSATVGKTITVRVAISKSGYTTATVFSAPTAEVIPGVIESVSAPRITGTTKVGSTLVAKSDTWTTSGITKRYYWFAGDELVQVSTSAKLKLGWEERGTVITVEVRGSKAGYTADTSERSAGTAAIR